MCSEHRQGRLPSCLSSRSPDLSYNHFLSFQTQFLWDTLQAQQPGPLMTIIPLSFPRGTAWPSGQPSAHKHSTRAQLQAGQHPALETLLVRGQSIPFQEQHTVQCSPQPQDRGYPWSQAAEPAAVTQPCTKIRGRPMSAWQLSAARNKAEGCECVLSHFGSAFACFACRAMGRHGSSDMLRWEKQEGWMELFRGSGGGGGGAVHVPQSQAPCREQQAAAVRVSTPLSVLLQVTSDGRSACAVLTLARWDAWPVQARPWGMAASAV